MVQITRSAFAWEIRCSACAVIEFFDDTHCWCSLSNIRIAASFSFHFFLIMVFGNFDDVEINCFSSATNIVWASFLCTLKPSIVINMPYIFVHFHEMNTLTHSFTHKSLISDTLFPYRCWNIIAEHTLLVGFCLANHSSSPTIW